MIAPISVTRLPFWRTVIAAYTTIFANGGQLIRMAGAWIIGSTLVMAALYYTVGWQASLDLTVNGKPSSGAFFGNLGPEIIGLIAGVVLAVGWHRYVLLGHQPRAASLLERPTLNYFGWVFLSFVYAMVLISPFMLVYYFNATEILEQSAGPEVPSTLVESAVTIGISFIVLTIACYLPTRLTLILPARALNHDNVSAGTVWQRSRKNFWALYLGLTACGFIPIVLVFMLPEKFSSREFFAIAWAAYYLVSLVCGMIGVTFLSLAYRHLFPEMFEDAGRTSADLT